MTVKQRTPFPFDTASLLLFAALSMGGGTAALAQTAVGPAFGPAPGASQTAAGQAFDRADTNKDGQLSAQEATMLPAISQRFKELDTDKSGSLSRAEFDKGVQS